MRSDSAVYKLELPCRAISAVVDPAQHLFMLGTLSLKGKNQIYLLEFKEESSLCECLATWLHPFEIWSISACPSTSQKDLFFTTHGTSEGARRAATLWTKERGTNTGLGKLVTVTDLDVLEVLWEPQGFDVSSVLALTRDELVSVSIEQDGQHASSVSLPQSDGGEPATRAAWDPHHLDVCTVSAGPALHRVDLRAGKAERIVSEAHPFVHCLQYNPNRQYHLLTGGDDGYMRFWDVRHARQSLRAVRAHDHWVTCARHNPFHEQLVLSGSTDRQAATKLWSLPSFSSPPAGANPPAVASDTLLKTLPDFDDSVYGVAWSALSPWLFASVSYSSKVVVSQVPRETKYSILLSE